MTVTLCPNKLLYVNPTMSAVYNFASMTTRAHPGRAAFQAERNVRLLLMALRAHNSVREVNSELRNLRRSAD